jgi:hypothetical protein
MVIYFLIKINFIINLKLEILFYFKRISANNMAFVVQYIFIFWFFSFHLYYLDNLLIKYNTDNNYLTELLHSNETDANNSMKNDLNLIKTHNLKTELDISVDFLFSF